jgi:hypothetical protein
MEAIPGYTIPTTTKTLNSHPQSYSPPQNLFLELCPLAEASKNILVVLEVLFIH